MLMRSIYEPSYFIISIFGKKQPTGLRYFYQTDDNYESAYLGLSANRRAKCKLYLAENTKVRGYIRVSQLVWCHGNQSVSRLSEFSTLDKYFLKCDTLYYCRLCSSGLWRCVDLHLHGWTYTFLRIEMGIFTFQPWRWKRYILSKRW
jgi:hypothetical protein